MRRPELCRAGYSLILDRIPDCYGLKSGEGTVLILHRAGGHELQHIHAVPCAVELFGDATGSHKRRTLSGFWKQRADSGLACVGSLR